MRQIKPQASTQQENQSRQAMKNYPVKETDMKLLVGFAMRFRPEKSCPEAELVALSLKLVVRLPLDITDEGRLPMREDAKLASLGEPSELVTEIRRR